MADIVLICPRFDPSYWGLEYALPIFRKQAAMPVAALPLLAALTPPQHTVTIIDENVEPIDFERLQRADIVGLTGLSVQRTRMLDILKEIKRRGGFTVVGGAWVTVKEDYFGELADVVFIGEAEESWPQFLEDWAQGRCCRRYEQFERTDMSRVPLPRYDLLKMDRYLFGSIQLSRGCPFQCEFCDIIVTFGRRPRFKTVAQIIAELEQLRSQKMEVVFIVDDNLIGNRKFIRTILPEIAAWQRRRRFPFVFVSEASLDLAEDEELMQLMLEANILSVFIGVESPNEEALRETRKFQNLASRASLLDRIHKVQSTGLEVWCGMILGFDHDNASIFDWQRQFLKESRITEAMVGMLYAIPKTPLYSRLFAEGRLDITETEAEFGTNVIPLRMSRGELRDGYIQLMQDLYQPEAYFTRLQDFIGIQDLRFAQANHWHRHFLARTRAQLKYVLRCAFLFYQLMRHTKEPLLRREYRRRIAALPRARRDRAMVVAYLLYKCAAHYHYYTLAKQMAEHQGPVVNPYQ